MRARYLARLTPVAFLAACCLYLQAASFELSVSHQEPPAELPAPVSEFLTSESVQINSPKGLLFEFWLGKEAMLGGENAGAFGIVFGELKPGSLLGVLRVGQEWKDYKNKPVRPGLYTVRYGLQPADGNHMGVSAYRDFGLLLPVAEDTDPSVVFEYEDLVKMGSLASGTPHPAVMGLFPLDEDIEEPTLAENEEGQPILAIRIGSTGFGFVLEGHGEIEGY